MKPSTHRGKQVAHARSAHAHKHLHKLRGVERQKGNARLTSHSPAQAANRGGGGARVHAREVRRFDRRQCTGSPCQQGLASARWPAQEHAARDARATLAEALGLLEKVDNLLQLHLRGSRRAHVPWVDADSTHPHPLHLIRNGPALRALASPIPATSSNITVSSSPVYCSLMFFSRCAASFSRRFLRGSLRMRLEAVDCAQPSAMRYHPHAA